MFEKMHVLQYFSENMNRSIILKNVVSIGRYIMNKSLRTGMYKKG